MRGGTMYEQKEIVLLPFPYTDLSISKLRPALIISNKKLNNSEDRICCLITSNSPKEGLLLEKNSFEKGTLPFKSWVKPQRIFTINSKIIQKSLCKIKPEFYNRILKEINEYIK
jgi:mRNA interferase MazF